MRRFTCSYCCLITVLVYGFPSPDLDGVWKLKPVLDGKSIMGVLQVKSGGPLIGQWVQYYDSTSFATDSRPLNILTLIHCWLLQQQRALKWQLAHPRGTMDDCIEWMKQSQQSKRQKVEKPDSQ